MLDDFLQHRVEILLRHHVTQIDEANGLADLGMLEEGILLLIAQHLHGRFAEDGEIERGFLDSRVGENDLVRERGLAATRRARDDVEGKLRDAPAQDRVEAANARWQGVDPHLLRLVHDLFRQAFLDPVVRLFHRYFLLPAANSMRGRSGHSWWTNCSVKSSPIKLKSNVSSSASTTTPPS